jgi:Asp-tRNA(Asn)/Glu-tRNA(Gln) amidotransferase A subunit family amidase
MAFSDYGDYDALGLAGLLRAGQVSADELLDEALARVEASNPKLNAVTVHAEALARRAIAAGLPEGPFTGVPMLLKDLGQYCAGLPLTNGSRFSSEQAPGYDGNLTERYKRAGLVIHGRTASPEFGLTTTTESRRHGPARNPWDTECSTGGSSGGAAAVVAAGVIPAAHATDGGGSIRIPASCCGLFGLKPTRGRVSSGPDAGEGWNGLAIGHAVTRSVRDSAALLDIATGPAPGDPYWAEPPARPFLDEVGADPGRLRVALCLETFNGTPCDPACAASAREAAKLCQSLGHQVEETGPEIDRDVVQDAILAIISVQTALLLDLRGRELGRACTPDDVERATWWRWAEAGREISGVRFQAAIDTLHGAGRRLGRFFERHDVLLTPTQPIPTPRLGWLDPDSEDQETYVERVLQSIGFTAFFNATGVPAMSVPLHWTESGLPQGTQFAAAYANEALLFRLAAQLEAAQPWAQRRSPGFGG